MNTRIMGITNGTRDDYVSIAAMNREAIPHVTPLSQINLETLHKQAFGLRVAREYGRPCGFLLAFSENADYASINFQWFKARYPSFVYIDRIVIAPSHQRRGLGRMLYDDIAGLSVGISPLLTCEVNIVPQNPGSWAFHAALGFREVGQQDVKSGKRVGLLVRQLP